MHTVGPASSTFRFGRCQLSPHERELCVDGKAVHLGGRAFDLLLLLVESRGKLVTKDEMLSRVWPGVIVEENTLHAQICALRKAMGTDRDVLKTISGRGYRFTAELDTTSAQADAASERGVVRPSLPRSLTDIFAPEMSGCETELADVLDLAAALLQTIHRYARGKLAEPSEPAKPFEETHRVPRRTSVKPHSRLAAHHDH